MQYIVLYLTVSPLEHLFLRDKLVFCIYLPWVYFGSYMAGVNHPHWLLQSQIILNVQGRLICFSQFHFNYHWRRGACLTRNHLILKTHSRRKPTVNHSTLVSTVHIPKWSIFGDYLSRNTLFCCNIPFSFLHTKLPWNDKRRQWGDTK